MARQHIESGFSLLEVLVALAILAMWMTALLTAQSWSIDKSGRARDLSIATLLARGKMIDIEQQLLDEGFSQGAQEDNGDFGEEEHREIRWHSKVTEVELSLDGLSSMCGGFSEEGDNNSDQEGGCESMFDGFGGALEGLTSEVSQSMRVVELNIEWGDKKRLDGKFKIRGIVIRDDYKLGTPAAPYTPNGDPNALRGTGGAQGIRGANPRGAASRGFNTGSRRPGL